MKTEMVAPNAVIVANSFNPSVFSPLWLVKQKLAEEDEILPGAIQSEVVTNVRTKRYALLVMPQQLQFVPAAPDLAADLAAGVVGRIIETLPHVPYTAAGINFVWFADPAEEGVATASRRLFFREGPVFRHFGEPDAHFGTYMSKAVLGGRLKLDIKPVTLKKGVSDAAPHRLQFIFNFHRDATDVGSLVEHIGRWRDFEHLARQIMDDLNEGVS